MSDLELSNNRCVALNSRKRGFLRLMLTFKADVDGRKGGFNSRQRLQLSHKSTIYNISINCY